MSNVPIKLRQRSVAGALEIHVDRGDGKGSQFLSIDTVVDTLALPGTPTGWQYKVSTANYGWAARAAKSKGTAVRSSLRVFPGQTGVKC
jgi:hypothetical protein